MPIKDREERNRRDRERYATNAAYRERLLAKPERREANLRHRAKIMSTPDLREASNASTRRWKDKARAEALAAYGNRCACCGETHPVFLAIDHVDGNGSAHRKEVGHAASFWAWLRREGYPEGFQVLCFNCNWAKWRGGCPHADAAQVA